MKLASILYSPRWIVSLWLLMLPVVGCVAMDSRVDHSIQIINVGKSSVTDVVYTYGELGPRPIKSLGLGGGGVIKIMSIPELIDVKWTTEADGQVHEVQVPLKSKVSAREVSGKTVSIEIDGPLLKVFLVTRLPDFREERKQLY